ncbi:uncharacterized protein LOC116340598 [Contarinia nasturtii]|uniref:uncharacterized protein LOC116340598 n=1 Tax=Contarinia nasturtii TaxID=265458 RepID=UPI0012D468C8|nr:uncharacterized protein LOC116340598 [Contarinia nasturtii]
MDSVTLNFDEIADESSMEENQFEEEETIESDNENGVLMGIDEEVEIDEEKRMEHEQENDRENQTKNDEVQSTGNEVQYTAPSPKKSEISEKKTDPQVNKSFKPDEILKMIKDNILYPDSPPKNKNTHAEAWKNGMKYLYKSENGDIFKNWYYCEKCNWVKFVWLKGGTSVINNHHKNHEKDNFSLTRKELAILLSKATAYGLKYGYVAPSVFLKKMPKDKWSDEFWETLNKTENTAVATKSSENKNKTKRITENDDEPNSKRARIDPELHDETTSHEMIATPNLTSDLCENVEKSSDNNPELHDETTSHQIITTLTLPSDLCENVETSSDNSKSNDINNNKRKIDDKGDDSGETGQGAKAIKKLRLSQLKRPMPKTKKLDLIKKRNRLVSNVKIGNSAADAMTTLSLQTRDSDGVNLNSATETASNVDNEKGINADTKIRKKQKNEKAQLKTTPKRLRNKKMY